MSKSILFYAAILLIATTTACSKKVNHIDDSFIGDWTIITANQDNRESLVIDEHGDACYEHYQNGERVEFAKGPARLDGDYLKVGSLNTFRVTQFPAQGEVDDIHYQKTNEYDWSMKLGKQFFYRN